MTELQNYMYKSKQHFISIASLSQCQLIPVLTALGSILSQPFLPVDLRQSRSQLHQLGSCRFLRASTWKETESISGLKQLYIRHLKAECLPPTMTTTCRAMMRIWGSSIGRLNWTSITDNLWHHLELAMNWCANAVHMPTHVCTL